MQVNSVDTKVKDAINGAADRALDSFTTYATDQCNKLARQNNIFDFLSKGVGLSRITDGLKNTLSTGLAEALKNSPLRKMAEDALAENIAKYSRNLSQNILNIIPTKITQTLKDLRSVVFNATYMTIVFQNNMSLFFTMRIAQECVDAIRDKRRTLIGLKASIIQVHNAIALVADSSPFMGEYLKQLRAALAYIDGAEKNLTSVQANFFINNTFLVRRFKDAQFDLDQAFKLIMPPDSAKEEHPEASLLEKLLDGMDRAPSYQQQLTNLLAIPKFVMEMLGSYDLYVVKVVRVNTLLTGFLSSIQNLQQLSQGKNKDIIIGQLSSARASLKDIIESMGTAINGGPDLIYTYKKGFIPNAPSTAAKAIEWGVRVKSVSTLLDVIDPDAVSSIQIANNGLNYYNEAVAILGKLNNWVTPLAILRADAGREEAGDIEGNLATLAVQANLCILGLVPTTNNKFDYRSVQTLALSLEKRVQMSIDRDREVEMVLLQFINKVAPIVEINKNLGNSIYKLLDDLGMDRAADFLKRGAWSEFFSLSGTTADYIGGAVTGLSLLLRMVNGEAERECVVRALGKLSAADVTKKLESERSLRFNYTKQQRRNESTCQNLQEEISNAKGCAAGVDVNQLFSYPFKSLQNAFKGVFGSSIVDSVSGTFGAFGEVSGTKIAGMPLDVSSVLKSTSGVFSSKLFSLNAIKESALFAGRIQAPLVDTVKSITSAANSAAGAVTGAISAASGAVNSALDAAKGAVSGVTGELTDIAKGAIGPLPPSIGNAVTGQLGEVKGDVGASLGNLVPTAEITDTIASINTSLSLDNDVKLLVNGGTQVENAFERLEGQA